MLSFTTSIVLTPKINAAIVITIVVPIAHLTKNFSESLNSIPTMPINKRAPATNRLNTYQLYRDNGL